MYQRYILSGFSKKIIIYVQISWEFGNFTNQNTVNLSKNVSFEVSFNKNECYDMYHIAKVLIKLIYHDKIQSPNLNLLRVITCLM